MSLGVVGRGREEVVGEDMLDGEVLGVDVYLVLVARGEVGFCADRCLKRHLEPRDCRLLLVGPVAGLLSVSFALRQVYTFSRASCLMTLKAETRMTK